MWTNSLHSGKPNKRRSFPSPRTNLGSCTSLWLPIWMATSFVSSMISGATSKRTTAHLLLPNAPQHMRRPQKQLAVRHRDRAQAVVVHIVLGDYFELGAGLDHGRHAILVGDVDFPIGQDR